MRNAERKKDDREQITDDRRQWTDDSGIHNMLESYEGIKGCNVEVSCGPSECRTCMAFSDRPANYTPSAPLVCSHQR